MSRLVSGTRRERGEELAELLDQGDARAHERVDHTTGDVHGIRNQVALERELDRARDRDARLLLRFVGRRAQVRGDDDVRQAEQPVRGAALGRRLAREDVEARAGDDAGREGFVQRVLVDEPAAGDIDDVGGRLHRGQLRGADHPGRLRGLRHVHRDEVALAQHLVEGEQLHLQLLRAGGGDVGVVADDAHAEGAQALGDEAADAAETEDADGLLEQLGTRVGAALPRAAGERRVRGGDVPREAQDVADGELGGRDDIRGRRVDDHDARGGRRLDVDVVEADARARDDLELRRGGQRLGVDPGRRADEHGVRVGESREQGRPVGAVDIAHVEVGTERVDRGGRELFSDQHDGLRHGIRHRGRVRHREGPSVRVREARESGADAPHTSGGAITVSLPARRPAPRTCDGGSGCWNGERMPRQGR